MDIETKVLVVSDQRERMEYMKRFISSNPVGIDIDIDKCEAIINGMEPYNEFDAEFKVESVDDIVNAVYEYGSMLLSGDSKRPAKVRKCKACGADMKFSYADLVGMAKNARRYETYHMPCICKKCNKKRKPKAPEFKRIDKPINVGIAVKLPLPGASKEEREAIYNENVERYIGSHLRKATDEATAPIVIKGDSPVAKPKAVSTPQAPLDLDSILKDAVKKTHKHRTKIGIQREIEPMHGNSLGNLLKDIKL